MAVYGYCRVSTTQQSIERQIKNIMEAYPAAKIYAESYTGTTMSRPEWERLLKKVQSGDVLVFDSVSRMSRTALEGWNTYQALYEQGIDLVFLKEHHIDSSVYREALTKAVPTTGTTVDCIIHGINQFLLELAAQQVQLAFEQSEKEVADLRQRTREGMAAAGAGAKISAQKVGKSFTTKKERTAKDILSRHCKEFGGTLSDPDVMKLAEVSRNSFYKYKAELRKERSTCG